MKNIIFLMLLFVLFSCKKKTTTEETTYYYTNQLLSIDSNNPMANIKVYLVKNTNGIFESNLSNYELADKSVYEMVDKSKITIIDSSISDNNGIIHFIYKTNEMIKLGNRPYLLFESDSIMYPNNQFGSSDIFKNTIVKVDKVRYLKMNLFYPANTTSADTFYQLVNFQIKPEFSSYNFNTKIKAQVSNQYPFVYVKCPKLISNYLGIQTSHRLNGFSSGNYYTKSLFDVDTNEINIYY